MSVYPRLLLSAGGGIVSSLQQAEQEKGTATVLIGLGGTGVHCIRTIKTQVYARLKPDDPDAVVPRYSHIRFLGVDTTEASRGQAVKVGEEESQGSLAALDDTEFFNIGNKMAASAFANKGALKIRKELDWLEHERIELPDLTDGGAGGVRQAGRFMMMDRSQVFMSRLQQEIEAAKLGLNNVRVNVHIFAGLSGGTGSGCFLDVCYMVRHLAASVGGVTTFGYFFLPDVNLSNVPHEDTGTRSYIPKNGYAAMQELDYCMNLGRNGGAFEQEYQGHKAIRWDGAPVDMCHLVSATNANGDVIPNAYEYAMNVVAEYVMDFLTYTNKEQALVEHLANYKAKTHTTNEEKRIGSSVDYCVLGASSASVPLKAINTYLASELFERFAPARGNAPSRSDVEGLALASLARGARDVGEVYGYLMRELREGAGGEYGAFPDDWKFVREYGNKELVEHYTRQTANKVNRAEANAKSMSDPDNVRSLISRVRAELASMLPDMGRGPAFAHGCLSAAVSHNLGNIVDGVIAENLSNWNQEAAQADLRQSDYESAKAAFERGGSFGARKRFEAYEFYLCALEQHNLAIQVHERLDSVLKELKSQLAAADAGYYAKLARTVGDLFETFDANREALASERVLGMEDAFSTPLMTMEELRPTLEAEVARLDVPGAFGRLVSTLVDNEGAWTGGDENEISRVITRFFVEWAFGDFAGRSIDAFLRDKYEAAYGPVSDEKLAEFVYEDYMKPLAMKAAPLFPFDGSVWDSGRTSQIAYLSYPAVSAPVGAAAKKMHEARNVWDLKESSLTDRIFAMSSSCGLPLSAYASCGDYEAQYFASTARGRHYYEDNSAGSGSGNWRLLPSVTPQSLIQGRGVRSVDFEERLEKVRALYASAREAGVIDDDGYVCEPDPAALRELLDVRCPECERTIGDLASPADVPAVRAAIDSLSDFKVGMNRTDFQFPQDGHRGSREDIERICEDHFAYSPAVQKTVEGHVARYDEAMQRVHEICNQGAAAIEQLGANVASLKAYLDALFSGIIGIEGKKVVYKQDNFGISVDIVLSEYSDEYPYKEMPVYQGYLSFKDLDEEIRAEIKDATNGRLSSGAPEIAQSAQSLGEGELNDKRLQAMAQRAISMAERDEIMEFLGRVKTDFAIFCGENL